MRKHYLRLAHLLLKLFPLWVYLHTQQSHHRPPPTSSHELSLIMTLRTRLRVRPAPTSMLISLDYSRKALLSCTAPKPRGIARLWVTAPGDHHDITIRQDPQPNGLRPWRVPFQMLTWTRQGQSRDTALYDERSVTSPTLATRTLYHYVCRALR